MENTNPPAAPCHCHHSHHDAATATAMLREEHEVILRALALLERFGRRLETQQPVDRNGLGWLREFFVTFADRCHHSKEEQHLFPALERHGIPKEGGPVGMMLYEHEEGRALLRAMAQGDDRQVAEAIRGYTALLRGHIDKENGILFSMADQVLPEEEQRELLSAFGKVEHVMVDPGAHERFLTGLDALEKKES